MESIDLDRYASRQEAVFVRKLVSKALANGWLISVNDGEEWTVKQSSKRMEVLEALASTGADTLLLRDPTKLNDKQQPTVIGRVTLLYDGNSNGEEVVQDHSDNEAMTAFIASLGR